MTIEEALAKIRGTGAYWIVWHMQTGEILSVTEADASSQANAPLSHLSSLKSFGVPVKTRWVQAENVTHGFLVGEQADAVRIQSRVAVLNAWATAPVEALVQILERGEYSPPMRKDGDSRIIVEHLWDGHRDEIVGTLRQRLRALVGTDVLCEAASRKLKFALLALEGDRDTLRSIWRRERPGRASFADDFMLMDCFAHLQIADPDIVDDIIAIVEATLPFGARHEAMLALGKLGSQVGTRAAAAIRRSIYDSSPEVVAERERVLERIGTPASDWERCGACCYGRVHSVDSHCLKPCARCLGLGTVRRTGTSFEPERANVPFET